MMVYSGRLTNGNGLAPMDANGQCQLGLNGQEGAGAKGTDPFTASCEVSLLDSLLGRKGHQLHLLLESVIDQRIPLFKGGAAGFYPGGCCLAHCLTNRYCCPFHPSQCQHGRFQGFFLH